MSEPWEDGDEVAEAARDAAVSFEAVLMSLRKDKNGINLIMAVSPIDVPNEILLAPVGSRYQIAAVRLDDQEMPVKGYKTPGEKAIASASAIIKQEAFQDWLVATNKMKEHSESAALLAIYSECGISSRREFKTSDKALKAFRRMIDLYEEHIMKTGG